MKRDDGAQMPIQLAEWVERSGDGRYFWGVLNQFGGLDGIRNYLLHNFWKGQFENLGASSSRTEDRKKMIIPALKTKLRKQLNDPISKHIPLLADKVLEVAEQQKHRVFSLNWNMLSGSHNEFMTGFLGQNEHILKQIEESDWRDEQAASLEPSVQVLCQKNILHQGYECKCKKCLHKFWISVEKLDSIIKCDICQTPAPAPVARPWDFRLNEFFREALRLHGILPLFWALEKMPRIS